MLRMLPGVAGTLAVLLAGLPAAAFELTILHTNDVHARLDQITAMGATCTASALADGKCVGGAARLATKMRDLRQTSSNSILVDAGDWFQGTLFYSQLKSAGLAPVVQRLGYDAMTVGNHEFDDGPAELARFIGMATVPTLAANLDTSNAPLLDGRIARSVVVERGGQRLGLIGLANPETPILASPGPALAFGDPAAALALEAATLRADGVEVLIVLSHLGLTEDLALASKVAGVDVIVGGHTHSLLSNTIPGAVGPYPMVVKRDDGTPVLVVQAGSLGAYIGRLSVTFDDAGVPVAWSGDTVAISSDIPPDPQIQAVVDQLKTPLAELAARPVGESAVDLEAMSCRLVECPLGNLVTDAILWQTRGQGVEVALHNGGGIRAGLAKGAVTLGGLLEMMPFSNTVATFSLTGADLRAALENGVSRANDPAASGTGRFLQVAGLHFTWDAARPVGERVGAVEVRQPDGSYAALDPAKLYKVATNDYLRQGGDGYAVFKEKAQDVYDAGPNLDDVLARYIAAASPIAPQTDGRITRVN